MAENKPNLNSNSLIGRLIVISLISIVIMVTAVAGKKATEKNQKSQVPTPQVLTPTPSLAKSEPLDQDRCFITLNGKRYDVTEFKTEHEGGNVFVCGTDMTDQFKDEHKNDFARAEDYEVDENGNFLNKN